MRALLLALLTICAASTFAWNKKNDLLVVGSVDHTSARVLFEALRPQHVQRAHVVDSAAGAVLATTDVTFNNRAQVRDLVPFLDLLPTCQVAGAACLGFTP